MSYDTYMVDMMLSYDTYMVDMMLSYDTYMVDMMLSYDTYMVDMMWLYGIYGMYMVGRENISLWLHSNDVADKSQDSLLFLQFGMCYIHDVCICT